MILHSEQVLDKRLLDRQRESSSDFLDFVASDVKRELVTKLMDELEDHELHVIQLSEPEFIEDRPEPGTFAVRQHLKLANLVQCKNCRMVYPWCQKFKFELGGEGYCPYGKELFK